MRFYRNPSAFNKTVALKDVELFFCLLRVFIFLYLPDTLIKRTMRGIILNVALLSVVLTGYSQGFVHQSNALGISVPIGISNFGTGVSFFDFNQDGWDDLSIGTVADGTYLYLNAEGEFNLLEVLPNAHECKAVVWGDYNNDGQPDLFVGSHLGPSQLWEQDDLTFSEIASEVGVPSDNAAMTFGASWTDYDLDGDLDLYITNYNQGTGPHNWLLRNHEGEYFEEVAEAAGIDNGIVWSFMPVFADFDHDGWPDLYVINDKLAPNALFRNNGDGTFADMSDGSNTDIVIDAMSNSITDFDNDGDLDIYVTNDFTGNRLFRNDGDFVFTDITEETNATIGQFCWAGLWIDFDNNKQDDIFIATTDYNDNQNRLFRISGQNTFMELQQAFSVNNDTPSYACAKGDYNRDGAPDFIQGNQGPFNPYLWRNDWDVNNWIGIQLHPVVSNPQALGAWVKVCTNGDCRTRYTTSADGYLGQHSQQLIFGLDTDIAVDSVVIEWPSGHLDHIFSPAINKYHSIIEGETLSLAVSATDGQFICEDGVLSLSASPGYESYIWNNGLTGAAIQVTEAGLYSVTAVTAEGLSTFAQINVLNAPAPDFEVEVQQISCFGAEDGVISFVTNDSYVVNWSTGAEGMITQNWLPGTYSYEITDAYGCINSGEVEITQPEPIELIVSINHPNCFGQASGEVNISAIGGTEPYTFTSESGFDDLPDGTFTFTLTDANQCVKDTLVTLIAPDQLSVEVSTEPADENGGTAEVFPSGGTPPYEVIWSDGSEGAVADNLEAGAYSVMVIDNNGCFLTTGIIIDPAVNMNEIEFASPLIYPNPTNAFFRISGLQGACEIRVLDVQGREVYAAKAADANSFRADVSLLSSGMYTVILHSEQQDVRLPLMKW